MVMAFIRVENYLRKFLSIIPSQDLGAKALAQIQKKIPNIKPKIKVRGRVMYISGLLPAAKNEIFLRKKEILDDLQNTLGEKAPLEVNFQK